MAIDIPVFIINHDLLTWPRAMADHLASLPQDGFRLKIYFFDNASTYPPLLEYYEHTEHEVVRNLENYGPKGLWMSLAPGGGLFEKIRGGYYIATDPDLAIDHIPDDMIHVLFNGLSIPNNVNRVGLSLEIEDLPEDGLLTEGVKTWEKQFWIHPDATGYWNSTLDSTFALHKITYRRSGKPTGRTLRTDRPYTAKHLPWYFTRDNITEEYRYYVKHMSAISSYGKAFALHLKEQEENG